MRYLKILIILISVILVQQSFSQGCSDAGICTFSGFDDITFENSSRTNTEITYVFGLGERQSLNNTLQVNQSFNILKDKGSVFFRLPFTFIYGNLGHTAGLGDVTAGMEYLAYYKNKVNISITGGLKIPSNGANKTSDGKGLPMAYQTSLGTYDLLVGAGISITSWHIGLAYQKPFGSNDNTFLLESWEGNGDAMEYFESNQLKRGDDVMLRLDKGFVLKNKNSLKAGLLGVYRLQKDQIVKEGETIRLENSDGLTLNASLGYEVRLKNHSTLRFLLAAPLITRETLADGLTRTLVFSFTYSFGN